MRAGYSEPVAKSRPQPHSALLAMRVNNPSALLAMRVNNPSALLAIRVNNPSALLAMRVYDIWRGYLACDVAKLKSNKDSYESHRHTQKPKARQHHKA